MTRRASSPGPTTAATSRRRASHSPRFTSRARPPSCDTRADRQAPRRRREELDLQIQSPESIDGAPHREAFPRRGWRTDLERRLDGLRLINWHQFNDNQSVSAYTPPVLRTALALHESLLFQPFEFRHARESLRETELVGPRGEEVEHAAYWLFLDEPTFKATLQLAADLGELREKVTTAVDGWAFIDQAFEYLRRSEDAEGYEQFVMLTAVVDCLLSKGGSQASGRTGLRQLHPALGLDGACIRCR
jgi:hypothetical protein